jgi:thiamine-phosphate pyrophosphorylase
VGVPLVSEYKKLLRIPFVAIGGVDADTVADVIAAGADRVAVVRAVGSAPSVETAARTMKESILKAKASRHATV